MRRSEREADEKSIVDFKLLNHDLQRAAQNLIQLNRC